MSENDLFVDPDGHVLLRDEQIDDMLSRLDEEVREQNRRSDDSAMQPSNLADMQLPQGLQWLPPNVDLEYDWINAAGRDEEDRPGPPMIELALRVKRRRTGGEDETSSPLGLSSPLGVPSSPGGSPDPADFIPFPGFSPPE